MGSYEWVREWVAVSECMSEWYLLSVWVGMSWVAWIDIDEFAFVIGLTGRARRIAKEIKIIMIYDQEKCYKKKWKKKWNFKNYSD